VVPEHRTLAEKHGIDVHRVSGYEAIPDAHMDAVRIVTAMQDGTILTVTDPVDALERASRLYAYIEDLNAAAGDYRLLDLRPGSVLNEPPCAAVSGRYLRWAAFMEERVRFLRGRDGIHGVSHCARVLLLALAMGHALGLSDAELDALATAAVFHDSRRDNDMHDPKHGTHGAEYYRACCEEGCMGFDRRVHCIIAYHDRPDGDGLDACAPMGEDCVRMYRIFKDADGLDRIRLNREYLDTGMLRTDIAESFLPVAERILRQTREGCEEDNT
jgi:hypothetical protein